MESPQVPIVSERVTSAASLLHDLWGDALPPGHTPWEVVVADVLAVDDEFRVYGAVTL